MNERKFIALLGGIIMVCRLWAQQKEINFTSLTTENGLSANTVNTILKDHYGIIWLGTDDGLNKFDGTRFTIYRYQPDNPGSLKANEILSLHEDKKGNLWVGTSGGSLHLYDRKNDNFISFPSGPSPAAIRNNIIKSICSDHTGKIWIGHFKGISILDPKSLQINPVKIAGGNTDGTFDKFTLCLFEDSHQQMWVGTDQGLYRYNQGTKSFTRFVHANNDPHSLSGDIVFSIVEDAKNNLWIGTTNGLSKLSPGKSGFENFIHAENSKNRLSSNFINTLALDGGNLWIGGTEGLDIMNTENGKVTSFAVDPRNLHSLKAKSVRCIYMDNKGTYWLGTTGGGVNTFDKNLNLFNYVRSNIFDQQGLNTSIVTSFAESGKNKVFVGTDGKGMSVFDPATRLFQHFPLVSKRTGKTDQLSILAMKMCSNHLLYVGTRNDGLFVVNPGSGKYTQLLKSKGAGTNQVNDIYCITELSNGNILVGTNGEGIDVLNHNNQLLFSYTPHPRSVKDIQLPINGFIRDIKEDKNGDIWMATYGGGIAVFHPGKKDFSIYNTTNSKLPNDKVLSLLQDSSEGIWAGTFGGGLALFNDASKQFAVYAEKEGLQNSIVYKMIEDQEGLIWASTNSGISSIDINTKKINNYNYHNGLQQNNFVYGSGIQLSSGELYFGGLDGFNYFQPRNLIKNTNIPPVLITGLRVSNQEISVSKNGPISEHISVANDINVDYHQNFAIDFVGLNYTASEQNQYAYKMEGFEKEWNYVGTQTSASYTNLDPGDYIFRVRASNNDGVWNNVGKSINVHVHPPIWRTKFAYASYFVLLIGAVLYMRHKGIQKINRKFALEQQKTKAEHAHREEVRMHELNSQKIKFLTNLSHEFRTPISLLLGPVDQLLEKEKDAHAWGQLNMIRRNGKRLLNLVNQLLDFRKMEEHELHLQLTAGELVHFTKEVSDSFRDLAERKNIELVFTSLFDTLYTSFDHDKLERVLFNVLSNAFKFTKPGGAIHLKLENAGIDTAASTTWVALKVSDTGIGIPKDKIEKIFNLFFQDVSDNSILNQGTGIGLAITNEFVKMHDGNIKVDSRPGDGTTFSILIPFKVLPAPVIIRRDRVPATTNETTDPIALNIPVNVITPEAEEEISSILLVEDNDDYRYYLKDQLKQQHKVIEAANGHEGWKQALFHHPQLIVSDISMPEMNGIDLCRKIKADKRTRHIPVILLTALTGEENQLGGLMIGANDYITKPFNVNLLKAKIQNLLTSTRILKTTFSKQFQSPVPEVVDIPSADEELLQKIRAYLEENLSSPNLSVEELSKQIGMSRSSLYGKLLEITGQTPVEYIRSFKLDKAAALLSGSNMNVTQIAYTVGFSTPNYFAKSFKIKFNMLPSEFARMKKEGK